MKGKIYILPAIIATILGLICFCLVPKKAKAETSDTIVYAKKTYLNCDRYNYAYTYTVDFGPNDYYLISNVNTTGANSLLIWFKAPQYDTETLYNDNTGLVFEVVYIPNKTAGEIYNTNEDEFYEYFNEPKYSVYMDRDYLGINNTQNIALIEVEQKTYTGSLIVRISENYFTNTINSSKTINSPMVFYTPINVNQTITQNVYGYTQAQYDYNSRYQYDYGYSNGYDDGSDQGYDSGYEAAIEEIADQGAYQTGYNNGVKSNGIKIGDTISGIFTGLTSFLNIPIFGGITLGGILLLPIMFGALWVVLKIIRG